MTVAEARARFDLKETEQINKEGAMELIESQKKYIRRSLDKAGVAEAQKDIEALELLIGQGGTK